MDTIVALASAPGKAGVSVIRISGAASWKICQRICGSVPEPRKASVRFLRGADGETIDQALVLAFEENASFTGEKVVEFHVHGSAAVVAAVLESCLMERGARGAEAGEFTRRAYEAGRLSITQIEGLADLLDAETDLQRRQAMRLMGGEAERKLLQWREALLDVLVYLEASIDFSDQELPDGIMAKVQHALGAVAGGIQGELAVKAVSERVREGYEVAIVGKVNVGKSTLLNALAGRDVAITSEYAGTTRDVIEVRLNLGGFPVTMIDTAGLRDASDPVEVIGIERGIERARKADLRVYLKDGPDDDIRPIGRNDLILLGKCDRWGLRGISGKTGEGIEELIAAIMERLGMRERHSALFSRARHFSLLEEASTRLKEAMTMLEETGFSEEIVSELVRESMTSLDKIVGRIDVEEVLGGIFSSFCIGK